MQYSRFQYLWPPRPEVAVSPSALTSFEHKGYVGQIKKNGTASVIFVDPDRNVRAMNRYNEEHKSWIPNQNNMSDFMRLPGDGWYVFVAELLHNKVPGLRDINYVHDILVHDGEYLVGCTQEKRQDILYDLFFHGGAIETETHLVVSPNLWMPVEYYGGFLNLFNSLSKPEDEGLVLKHPKQKLQLCSQPKSNTNGMIKARRVGKNFSF